MILYFVGFWYYLGYYFTFALFDEMPACIFPFSQRRCYRRWADELKCLTDPLDRERYFQCDANSFSRIEFHSNNLLLLYSPFAEMILTRFIVTENVTFFFTIETDRPSLDVDLRLVDYARPSLELGFSILLKAIPARILFRGHSSFTKSLSLQWTNPMQTNLFTLWTVVSQDIDRNNDIVCYHFEVPTNNMTFSIPSAVIIPCPPTRCLAHTDKGQTCLGSNPCPYIGGDILLCRIDRLQSNDQFNLRHSLPFSDIIIITTDTHKDTLHRFSAHLLQSCITRRLVIVILHGRLQIPSLNSTSFRCSDGLSVEVEFWHGNCSTYEIVHDVELERMYETNLITLRDFYTGRPDGLEMACAVRPSQAFFMNKHLIPNIVVVCLLMIVIGLMCVVGWYYRNGPSYQ